ncbi:hypothetical protein GUJ93_ZPchr0337g7068 [Zizania palustris]|uniref:Uncharacterized protein n=1 Tax=Zizania palustris TaxID=103762 RepID=A0A8J5QS10_ZIZPA|nr:hypothetical protein GUJ93_ZPchr0337g7068 [Zizania palustris]
MEHSAQLNNCDFTNSNVLGSIKLGLIAVSSEKAPFCRQTRYGYQFHQLLPLSSIPESEQMNKVLPWRVSIVHFKGE